MSKNGEIYTAGKNFTLPPAVTAVTNSTSVFLFVFHFNLLGGVWVEGDQTALRVIPALF